MVNDTKVENKPLPPCCPKGSWGTPLGASVGVKSLVGAMGDLVMIGSRKDLEIYITKPLDDVKSAPENSEKKAIFVFPDVYGLQNRLFATCDKLAKDHGAYVVAIDFFRGDTMDNHPNDFFDWISKHPFDEMQNPGGLHPVSEDINSTLEYLTQTYDVDSSNIAAVGFCWGVWALTKACAMGYKFKCGVGFHPSLVIEEAAFKMNIIEMSVAAAKETPLLFCVSGNDPDNLKPPSGQVAEAVSSSVHERGKTGKNPPKCVEFPEMVHGWVARGDISSENVKRDAEIALKMGSDFLMEWM